MVWKFTHGELEGSVICHLVVPHRVTEQGMGYKLRGLHRRAPPSLALVLPPVGAMLVSRPPLGGNSVRQGQADCPGLPGLECWWARAQRG